LEQTNIENTGNTTLPLLGIFKSDLAHSAGTYCASRSPPGLPRHQQPWLATVWQRLARGTQVQEQEYQRAITPDVK
jgi:hypothetical protein